MAMGSWLGGNTGDSPQTLARLDRLERKLDLLLDLLGAELSDEHPDAQRIHELIASGQKIAAIKRLRQASGAGLAQAKCAVEDGTWVGLLMQEGPDG